MVAQRAERWLQLIYRVPSKPSKGRVAVWRELRRLGAYYPQHAVSVLPDRPGVREDLAMVRSRVAELGGTSFFAELEGLSAEDEQQLIDGFREGSEAEYAAIVEECQTRFVKAVEFERFRESYSADDADRIRQDLEKLRRWLEKAIARDWMRAPGRDAAERQMTACEELLEDFEAEIYERRETAYERTLSAKENDKGRGAASS